MISGCEQFWLKFEARLGEAPDKANGAERGTRVLRDGCDPKCPLMFAPRASQAIRAHIENHNFASVERVKVEERKTILGI